MTPIQGIITGFGLLGGGGGLAAVIAWLRFRRKDLADVDRVKLDAALAVQAQSIEYVQAMMAPLEKRLAAADAEVDTLRKTIRDCTRQLEHAQQELQRAIHRAELAEAILKQHGIDITYPDRRVEDRDY